MSNLRNIADVDVSSLPEYVKAQIENFVARGHKPEHLVVNEAGKVFFDSELALNEAFDEEIYDPHNKD